MENKLSIFQKYYQWSKERFPIPGIVLYGGSLFYLSFFFGNLFSYSRPMSLLETIPGLVVMFLILLHIRVFDEHKDYKKDVVAHPDRILSKGIITLKDLRILLYIAVAGEIALSLYLGVVPAIIWFCIMIWSLLMFVEFFVPEFLNRHMVLYLISHQIIVPITLLLGFSLRYDLSLISVNNAPSFIIFLCGVMCATITYEIARKTWSPDREHELADSYTKFWGIGKAVIVGQAVALCAGSAFIYIYIQNAFPVIYTIVIAVLYCIFLASGIVFYVKPENKISKIVEMAGVLFVLGLFINSIIAFYKFQG